MSKTIVHVLLGFIVVSGIVLFQRYKGLMDLILNDNQQIHDGSTSMWDGAPVPIMSPKPRTTIITDNNLIYETHSSNILHPYTSQNTTKSSSLSSSLLHEKVNDTHLKMMKIVDSDIKDNDLPLHDAERNTMNMEDISSVDYFSCCGLGHRLTKNTDAYFLAKLYRYGFRFHWGFCGDRVDVAHYLFGPINAYLSSTEHNAKMTAFIQRKRKQYNITKRTTTDDDSRRSVLDILPPPPTGHRIRIHNEVPGFRKFIREGPKQQQQNTNNKNNLSSTLSSCTCSEEYGMKLQSDIEFYTNLRDKQFRFHPAIQQFRLQHNMDQHYVMGMHIRSGNNETGQFGRKNRAIHNVQEWTTNIVKIVKRLWKNVQDEEQRRNPNHTFLQGPMLYLATDTPSLVHKIRLALQEIMPVVDLPQQRVSEGTGVAFGQSLHEAMAGKKQSETSETCLGSWRSALMDMILLSYSNMVIAARPSSFVQSMPMMMAFAKSRPYCEVNYNATDVQCFTSFAQWCCEGIGSFAYGSINQRYEYIRTPYETLWTQQSLIFPRGQGGSTSLSSCTFLRRSKNTCLPYHWPSQRELEQTHEMLFNNVSREGRE